ncbi:hypothetical protein B5S30_g732 [[Candida] boidinii]|nr:hypothetical protein B5S30_g732 [[Candida] boidinii]GMG09839.1 unnamed protein product [[Candida] boidinii]
MVRAINLIEAISSHLSESFGNSNDNSNDQNNDSNSNGLINNNNTNSYNNNNTINNNNGLSQARTFFVGGNFKMNGNKKSIKAIIDNLNSADLPSNVEVVISPPSIYLALAADAITAPTVSVAAQNCFNKASGAYTGEISPESLKDINVPWVILGHSERRTIIKESDEFIADKTKFALDSGLKVILCIGETYEEKQAGETLNVCKRQLKAVSDVVKDWTNIVVAYEPVWAIGTGLAATAQDAQDIHKDIRDYLSTVIGEQAASVRILYGGSANGKNCTDFRDKPDVDGFLVGGASLKPEFVDIIKSRQ